MINDYRPKYVVYSDGVRIRGFRHWYDAYALFVEMLEEYETSVFHIMTSSVGLVWVSEDELHSLELLVYED